MKDYQMPSVSTEAGKKADSWKPLDCAAESPRAALRLWLVKNFPSTAPDWELASELPKQETDASILRMIIRRLEDPDNIYASLREGQINRLWNNPNGITSSPNQRAYATMIRAAMELSDLIFPPIFSSESTGVLNGMDSSHLAKHTESEKRKAFQDRYSALIEPLRRIRDDLNVARMIAHYDSWIVYLHTKDEVPPEEPIRRTIESIVALRRAIARLNKRSPLTDLEDYLQLNNELANRCELLKVDPASQAELKTVAEEERFFAKAKRFNRLYPWNVGAMMQALEVACCLNSQGDQEIKRMQHFGDRALAAIYLALTENGEKITKDHPVLTFTLPVFDDGSLKPVEIKSLAEYIKTFHPAVLASFMMKIRNGRDNLVEAAEVDLE
jgi:hypothetical protein